MAPPAIDVRFSRVEPFVRARQISHVMAPMAFAQALYSTASDTVSRESDTTSVNPTHHSAKVAWHFLPPTTFSPLRHHAMAETESLLTRLLDTALEQFRDEASVHVGVRQPQLELIRPGRNNFRPASVASDIFGEILFLTFIFPRIQHLAQITAFIINVRMHSNGCVEFEFRYSGAWLIPSAAPLASAPSRHCVTGPALRDQRSALYLDSTASDPLRRDCATPDARPIGRDTKPSVQPSDSGTPLRSSNRQLKFKIREPPLRPRLKLALQGARTVNLKSVQGNDSGWKAWHVSELMRTRGMCRISWAVSDLLKGASRRAVGFFDDLGGGKAQE
ncbi:hypothetical protein DFH09DRAFT_1070450 [Mycena vulgaris]|nr:hypothetical protein DFH09DRAFT_1070450 [Mycena vulgaris]